MVKSPDIQKAFNFFESNNAKLISDILKLLTDYDTFYVKDLDDLIWQIIPANDFYTNYDHITGGTVGCSIGVSNMEKAVNFYDV